MWKIITIIIILIFESYTLSFSNELDETYNEARKNYLLGSPSKYIEAIKLYSKIVNDYPNPELVYSGLAESYSLLGRFYENNSQKPNYFYGKALEFAKLAYEKKPDCVETNRAMGNVFLNIGDSISSKRYLEKALKINPDDIESNYYYWNLKYPDQEASFIRDALDKDNSFLFGLNDLGYQYIEKGKIDDAMKLLFKALSVFPDNEIVLNNIGLAYIRLGKYEEARRYCLRSVSINKDYYLPYLNIAEAYFIEKKYEDAIPYYNLARNINPKATEASLNIGIIYYMLKDYKNSEIYLKEALFQNPYSSYSHEALGFLYLEIGDELNALLYLNKALKLESNNPDILLSLAVLFFKLKDRDNAIAYYEKAIKIDPNYLNAKKLSEENFWSEKMLSYFENFMNYYNRYKNEKKILEDDFLNPISSSKESSK